MPGPCAYGFVSGSMTLHLTGNQSVSARRHTRRHPFGARLAPATPQPPARIISARAPPADDTTARTLSRARTRRERVAVP